MNSNSVEERSTLSSAPRGQISETAGAASALTDGNVAESKHYDFAWYSDTKLVTLTLVVALLVCLAEDIPLFEERPVVELYTAGDPESCASYRTSLLIVWPIASTFTIVLYDLES